MVAFAIALQFLQWPTFAVVFVLLGGLLACRGFAVFLVLLRRARWLLLSMLLIYAFSTPGEYIPHMPDAWAPTYEGLRAGGLQMARLVAMLAALSLLLATSNREDIMAGIYLLLQPLRPLGLDPERFAARLWLTLHYVETMPKGVFHRLRQQGWRLEDILHEEVERPDSIHLQFPAFRLTDALLLAGLPLALWWLL